MGSVLLNFGVISDNVAEFEKALKEIEANSVYVGFPDGGKERESEDGNPTPITNAGIAYVQDKGMPELNIPARPFMEPGVENKLEQIGDEMGSAAAAALGGDTQKLDSGLHRAGLIAQQGIQEKILDGPFVPLSEVTLRERARKGRAGAQEELDRRASGEEPGVDLARPLNDSGQLRNAVTYAVKKG